MKDARVRAQLLLPVQVRAAVQVWRLLHGPGHRMPQAHGRPAGLPLHHATDAPCRLLK